MSKYVYDVWGGFSAFNPPTDVRFCTRFQSITAPRLAAGTDEGRWFFSFGAEADALFAVNDIVIFFMFPQEAGERLAAAYADDPTEYNVVGLPVERNTTPLTFVPTDGITIVPANNYSLSIPAGWRQFWLVKTADGSYELAGDLVPT
jgi:hypothetical protein